MSVCESLHSFAMLHVLSRVNAYITLLNAFLMGLLLLLTYTLLQARASRRTWCNSSKRCIWINICFSSRVVGILKLYFFMSSYYTVLSSSNCLLTQSCEFMLPLLVESSGQMAIPLSVNLEIRSHYICQYFLCNWIMQLNYQIISFEVDVCYFICTFELSGSLMA